MRTPTPVLFGCPSSVDATAVRTHVAELLASRSFASAQRLRSFLSYIVEATLNGQGDRLKEYVIATEVYGRDSSYDPQIDSTVRVEASRLRAKLREFYATHPETPALRIELPKGAYVPVFLAAEPSQSQASNRVTDRLAGDEQEQAPQREVLPAPASITSTSQGRYSRSRWAVAALAALLAVMAGGWCLSVPRKSDPANPPPAQAGYIPSEAILQQYLRADQFLRRTVLADGWSGELPATVRESVNLFEELTRHSPGFAKAWAGLAEAQEWAYELDRDHPRWRLDRARAAAEQAIAVDPHLAEAHSRLSALYFYSYGDLERAEQACRRAIELNPRDIRAQARYADLLRIRGLLPEALAALDRALAVESAAARLWDQRALILYDLDRLSESLAAADHALQLNSGNQMNQVAIAHWVRGLCLQHRGILTGAEAEFRRGLAAAAQDDRNEPALGHVLAKQGRTAEARDVLAGLKRQYERGKPVRYAIALVHAGLGEKAEAARWLMLAARAGETSYLFLKLDRRLRDLQG